MSCVFQSLNLNPSKEKAINYIFKQRIEIVIFHFIKKIHLFPEREKEKNQQIQAQDYSK